MARRDSPESASELEQVHALGEQRLASPDATASLQQLRKADNKDRALSFATLPDFPRRSTSESVAVFTEISPFSKLYPEFREAMSQIRQLSADEHARRLAFVR